MQTEAKAAGEVVSWVRCNREVRSAVKFLAPNLVVKATAVHRLDRRAQSRSFMLTIGRPNYQERKYVKLLKAAKVSFPVRRVWLRGWPKRRK